MTYAEVIEDWMQLREMVEKNFNTTDETENGMIAAILFAGYWLAETCHERREEH